MKYRIKKEKDFNVNEGIHKNNYNVQYYFKPNNDVQGWLFFAGIWLIFSILSFREGTQIIGIIFSVLFSIWIMLAIIFNQKNKNCSPEWRTIITYDTKKKAENYIKWASNAKERLEE